MSISWAAIEAEIVDWVATLGTPVIWSGQDIPRRGTPYIDLRAIAIPLGQDWITVEDAAVPVPGAEIDIKVQGSRELQLTVRCFGGTASGVTSPQALLNELITRSSLPSRQATMNAAGWAPARFTPPAVIDGVLGGNTFEPRVQFQCFGMVGSEITETATFIQIVEFTNQITGGTFTVDVGP